jgi:hypothetical protein
LTWQISSNPAPDATSGCNEVVPSPLDLTVTSTCEADWIGVEDITRSYTIRVQTSLPTSAATPSRAPDSNGWYNHPLSIAFHGSSFSGIATCTSATYSGPASPNATVTGTCTDNAGRAATASFSFPYDATAPSLSVGTDPEAESVGFSWRLRADVAPLASVKIVRAPGEGKKRSSKVYTGTAGTYTDSDVKDGVQYAYTITARDEAGNTSVRTIKVTPNPRLLTPVPRARLTAPPMLSWTPVREATYYNVQLFRRGKVLSAWPTVARLQLSRTWRYKGKTYRLRPGHYRWYVWPGLARRAADRYGRLIGKGTFVVSKPS